MKDGEEAGLSAEKFSLHMGRTIEKKTEEEEEEDGGGDQTKVERKDGNDAIKKQHEREGKIKEVRYHWC